MQDGDRLDGMGWMEGGVSGWEGTPPQLTGTFLPSVLWFWQQRKEAKREGKANNGPPSLLEAPCFVGVS